MTSRVLGVVREQVIAYLFGASAITDAFVAAFRIPNLLRDLFAEGALSAAFVPSFTDLLQNRGPKAAFDLYRRLFFWVCMIVGGICLLGIIFAPQIATLLAAGFGKTPGKMALTVKLARVMFPFPSDVSLSAVCVAGRPDHGGAQFAGPFRASGFRPIVV